MECPHCGRPGSKYYRGYCCKAHWSLHKKDRKVQYSCAVCDIPVVRWSSQVKEGAKVYCKRCPKNSGETHPNWKEGQYLNKAGYRLVLLGGEYKLEHRYAWEQANRACLLPEAAGMVSIHHINMNKTDNRPENLVMLSNAVHGRLHRFIDAGRFEEAKMLLLENLQQQAFYAVHPEHLDYYRDHSISEILATK